MESLNESLIEFDLQLNSQMYSEHGCSLASPDKELKMKLIKAIFWMFVTYFSPVAGLEEIDKTIRTEREEEYHANANR